MAFSDPKPTPGEVEAKAPESARCDLAAYGDAHCAQL